MSYNALALIVLLHKKGKRTWESKIWASKNLKPIFSKNFERNFKKISFFFKDIISHDQCVFRDVLGGSDVF